MESFEDANIFSQSLVCSTQANWSQLDWINQKLQTTEGFRQSSYDCGQEMLGTESIQVSRHGQSRRNSLIERPSLIKENQLPKSTIGDVQTSEQVHSTHDEETNKALSEASLHITTFADFPKRQNTKKTSKRRSQRKKEYKNFDFYFKRTAFRMMTQFFKQIFKPCFNLGKRKGQNVAETVKTIWSQ